jgi:uncharacterized protein (DUF1800 family)
MAELTGRKRFAHLYRRAGFGATLAEIDAARALHASEDTAFGMAVDRLLNYHAVSEVADRIQVRTDDFGESLIRWWLERMARTRRPLLERLTYFWHDHFATSIEKDGITAAMMQRQNETLRANALGNFPTLVKAISRDPAMMIWLDLVANRLTSPNENFAREVMELFSLGVGTPGARPYAEADIREATRAFTGYTIGPDGNFLLNAGQHDGGVKTVLGRTCESGDQVIDILTSHVIGGKSVCAWFITAKLFSFLVYPVTTTDPVVDGFAQTFVSSGLSIRALAEAILKSAQFSSNRAYRALVKSPVEIAASTIRMLGGERIPLYGVTTELLAQGQLVFHPPDVSGWTSGAGWINASSLLSRCNMVSRIVGGIGDTSSEEVGGVPVTSLVELLTTGSAKVDLIVQMLLDGDVPAASRDSLNAYADTSITDLRLRGLFDLVMALPEYQLN